MNIKDIRELAEIMEKNSLNVVEVSEGETNIRLERNNQVVNMPIAMPQNYSNAEVSHGERAQAEVIENIKENKEALEGETIKSPMIGVFYAAPSPEAAPFVSEGDTVKKGQVVCIIEAMKLLNEIVADKSGVISQVLVKSGDVVEFGQPLFKIN